MFLTGLFLSFFSGLPPLLYQHTPLEDVSEKAVSVGMVVWGWVGRELCYEIQISSNLRFSRVVPIFPKPFQWEHQ